MTHVDDFIDNPVSLIDATRGIRYAQWFLNWKRMPAHMQASFAEFYGDAKLFCDYQGERYRCTGASRMGDVWLAKNHNQDSGYDFRVSIDDCSNWGDK